MKFLDKDEIIQVLLKKGAVHPCHRCGVSSFSVIDGFSKLIVEKDLEEIQNLNLGGPTIPVIMIACNNCGAITMHGMGALGLLPTTNEVKRDGV